LFFIYFFVKKSYVAEDYFSIKIKAGDVHDINSEHFLMWPQVVSITCFFIQYFSQLGKIKSICVLPSEMFQTEHTSHPAAEINER